MEVFEQIITSFAIVGLVLATLISYLKVNKIWVRKHVKEVSESVSVVAAFLSLFTTMPFLVKALLIDQDYVTAGKWFISLVVFFVMVSIGIGVWARKGERLGFWKMLKQSLLTERGELTYLIQSFTKPKEAESILRILQLVSAVDHNLDEKELQIIESVAKPWGIQPKEIVGASAGDFDSDIETVRQAFVDYLAKKPPRRQASKVFDLVRFLIQADKKVTHEEQLILEELTHIVKGYLDQEYTANVIYEVLVVPQDTAERSAIAEELGIADLKERAGGEAYVAGAYFSEMFAEEVCHRYRNLNHFSTVEARTE